jgi:fructose-1,6-bisphosphatase/inositol monophosphatase family enzyme
MAFSAEDLSKLDGLLRDAARDIIMPQFRRLPTGAIRQKSGPLDLVTDADEAAEHFITEALERAYPGCLVVGEEAASRDRSLLTRLAGAELAFTVDPIDGTSNFAAGLPLFGTMAAVTVRGRVEAAVIHDPVSGSSAMARLGAGAWDLAADGASTPMRVAAPVPASHMTGAASWRYLSPELRDEVLPNLQLVAQVWDFRCAAHQYRMLAAGHCHFLMFNRLMPWDHLPGWLLHKEAGGYSAKFDGSAYAPGETTGGLICAPDHASWSALRLALLGS